MLTLPALRPNNKQMSTVLIQVRWLRQIIKSLQTGVCATSKEFTIEKQDEMGYHHPSTNTHPKITGSAKGKTVNSIYFKP